MYKYVENVWGKEKLLGFSYSMHMNLNFYCECRDNLKQCTIDAAAIARNATMAFFFFVFFNAISGFVCSKVANNAIHCKKLVCSMEHNNGIHMCASCVCGIYLCNESKSNKNCNSI